MLALSAAMKVRDWCADLDKAGEHLCPVPHARCDDREFLGDGEAFRVEQADERGQVPARGGVDGTTGDDALVLKTKQIHALVDFGMMYEGNFDGGDGGEAGVDKEEDGVPPIAGNGRGDVGQAAHTILRPLGLLHDVLVTIVVHTFHVAFIPLDPPRRDEIPARHILRTDAIPLRAGRRPQGADLCEEREGVDVEAVQRALLGVAACRRGCGFGARNAGEGRRRPALEELDDLVDVVVREELGHENGGRGVSGQGVGTLDVVVRASPRRRKQDAVRARENRGVSILNSVDLRRFAHRPLPPTLPSHPKIGKEDAPDGSQTRSVLIAHRSSVERRNKRPSMAGNQRLNH
ncbi:hypothetical protein BDK51DRAFT_51862 [Blyttiomyces helicus]|uniref:Uncharacterized protein n=1 Tax=Blyttiomyces helicus TaxID=388810 RepID=A0A4P9W7D9_9FUNG|nr:hypothetical protein BDK51DRAFT_51862 [Blyttiomyces helicus]|eukprot:RKO87295.1 hypothetical protein BDK51DRAFT_51862 [Blyttiomyces helicus]